MRDLGHISNRDMSLVLRAPQIHQILENNDSEGRKFFVIQCMN